jgi:hypothetical protein
MKPRFFSRRFTTGELGWVGLVVFVVLVDSIAWANQATGRKKDETMSIAWGRWLQSPGSRVATGIAWATLSMHLFLSWPLPGEKCLKHVVQKAVLRRYKSQLNGIPTKFPDP